MFTFFPQVRIGNGVTITLRHVVVADFRSDVLTQVRGGCVGS
jgi:hypothetical protein